MAFEYGEKKRNPVLRIEYGDKEIVVRNMRDRFLVGGYFDKRGYGLILHSELEPIPLDERGKVSELLKKIDSAKDVEFLK